MTAAERLKKRFKGGVPHEASKKEKDKKRVVPYGFLQDTRFQVTPDPRFKGLADPRFK